MRRIVGIISALAWAAIATGFAAAQRVETATNGAGPGRRCCVSELRSSPAGPRLDRRLDREGYRLSGRRLDSRRWPERSARSPEREAWRAREQARNSLRAERLRKERAASESARAAAARERKRTRKKRGY
jgi:hypothetical protein